MSCAVGTGAEKKEPYRHVCSLVDGFVFPSACGIKFHSAPETYQPNLMSSARASRMDCFLERFEAAVQARHCRANLMSAACVE